MRRSPIRGQEDRSGVAQVLSASTGQKPPRRTPSLGLGYTSPSWTHIFIQAFPCQKLPFERGKEGPWPISFARPYFSCKTRINLEN